MLVIKYKYVNGESTAPSYHLLKYALGKDAIQSVFNHLVSIPHSGTILNKINISGENQCTVLYGSYIFKLRATRVILLRSKLIFYKNYARDTGYAIILRVFEVYGPKRV